MVIQPLSTRLIEPNFCFDLPHRRSTTVSLETRNPWTSDKSTHPVALWESSNISHDLPALELLNSQHSLEISSVCQRLLVELDCSQNSSSSTLSKVVIARESPTVTTSFKVLTFHWSNDRKCARKSQQHACADVFQLCPSEWLSESTQNIDRVTGQRTN